MDTSSSVCYAVRMRLLIPLLAFMLLATARAWAQYVPEPPYGYSIKEASSQARLGTLPRGALWHAAEECSGIKLHGMFKVAPGMSSYFAVARDPDSVSAEEAEYSFTTAVTVF